MNIFEPCPNLVLANMAPEETKALDVLVHILQPELAVETGTWRGESAANFSLHCPVVSMDNGSGGVKPDLELLRGRPVELVSGTTPRDLSLLDGRVRGKRWIFLHDSEHYGDILVAEAEWAFSRGALCVLWHDYGMVDTMPTSSHRPSMPKGAEMLRERGHTVVRLLDCGVPEFRYYTGVERTFVKNAKGDATNWYTGVGLAWPKHATP